MAKLSQVAIIGGASAAIGSLATNFMAPDWTLTGTLLTGAAGAVTTATRQSLLDFVDKSRASHSRLLCQTLLADFRNSKIGTVDRTFAAKASLLKEFSGNIGNLDPISLSRELVTLRGDETSELLYATFVLSKFLHDRSPGAEPELKIKYPSIAPAIDMTIDAVSRRLADHRVTIKKCFDQNTSKDGVKSECDFAFMAVDTVHYSCTSRLRLIVPIYESNCCVLRDKRPAKGKLNTIVLNESASASHRTIVVQKGELPKDAGIELIESSDDFVTRSAATCPGEVVFAWKAVSQKLMQLNPNLSPFAEVSRYPRTVCLFADTSWCNVKPQYSHALAAFVKLFSYEWNRIARRYSSRFRPSHFNFGLNPKLEIGNSFRRAVA